MLLTSGLQAGDFWAITSYFNPVRYRRRHLNYKIFRKHLKIPLVAVELTYDEDFELQEGDADILVRVRGGAMLWQKERLLNVALQALPKCCKKVAWLDCDIIFCDDDWVESANRLLDGVKLVQLFKHVNFLPPYWDAACPTTEVEFSTTSAAYALSSGVPVADYLEYCFSRRAGAYSNGFAWGARRELLDRHGFYDACIIGGGDSAMVFGAHRYFVELMDRHHMNEHQRNRYRTWAQPFYDSVQGNTPALDGDILHLWHGNVADRATRTRHETLQRFRFDPFKDVAIQENGSWGWNTDKPELHDYVRNYFFSRREDG